MLYIVSTPIGNLADMTKRGIDTLRGVDLIACEDTRRSRILLDQYNISTPTVSYHQHSTIHKVEWLLDELKTGKDIALVSDAGTPGISDPGGVLVNSVHEHNKTTRAPIKIVSIPGPSSLTAALSVCGFPVDQFLYLGFIPKKKGRQSLLQSIMKLDKALTTRVIVFLESPVRIKKTLLDINNAFTLSEHGATPTRDLVNTQSTLALQSIRREIQVCLCRELTKKFEEVWRGSLFEAIKKVQSPQKGEFVVVLYQGK